MLKCLLEGYRLGHVTITRRLSYSPLRKRYLLGISNVDASDDEHQDRK